MDSSIRNPTNRGGVYRGPAGGSSTGLLTLDGVASVLVGDLDGVGVGGACPAGIPLTGTNGLIPDATILAQVVADQTVSLLLKLSLAASYLDSVVKTKTTVSRLVSVAS